MLPWMIEANQALYNHFIKFHPQTVFVFHPFKKEKKYLYMVTKINLQDSLYIRANAYSFTSYKFIKETGFNYFDMRNAHILKGGKANTLKAQLL